HPRRVLTRMLALGFARPRARMAAGASFNHWRRGPTPAAYLRGCSLSDLLVLELAWPQARHLITGGGAPPPPRTYAVARSRICSSSSSHGRRRVIYHWRWGPTPSAYLRGCSLSDLLVLELAWPQARHLSLALGPHPRRVLTRMLALGFARPRARMA